VDKNQIAQQPGAVDLFKSLRLAAKASATADQKR
jgi:hypothetical protein